MLLRSAWERVLRSWRAVALAAVGAALAWYIAHRVLGHAQPFFAPIAAAVALSSSGIQRGRRAVQLVAGVLLGIAVGEALSSAFGTGTLVLGAIVLITMSVAVMLGAGFFGQGMMFVNQAAASAILVVALHKHGTGPERALDALVGGAVAIVLGVGLFPVEPLGLLARAEGAVLSVLAADLTATARLLESGTEPKQQWSIESGHKVHRLLAELGAARSTARATVRIAPRRWSLRAAVDAESARTDYLDLLANAALSLQRAAMRAPVGEPSLAREIARLGAAIGRLADATRPWSRALVEEVRGAGRGAIERTEALQAPRAGVVASILAATATDLELVIDSGRDD